MKKLCAAIIMIAGLLVNGRGMAEQINISENLRHDQIVMPASAPERSRMLALDYSMFVEDEAAGIFVFYDDPRTKWEFDYIEFYDLQGNLLLASWIDAMGVCQVAVDRGLLNPDAPPSVVGTLVMIGVGQEL